MSRPLRLGIFAAAIPGLAALLFWSLAGLPDFGHYHWPYGEVLNRVGVAERHTTNIVNAVVFDYRGFDTLGEEFILFTAVAGVSLLLRKEDESRRPTDAIRSAGLRAGAFLLPVLLALGLWLIAFGFITPGGGFQGGVVVAGAFLAAYLLVAYRDYHALAPYTAAEVLEGFGVGAYAVLGFVGLAAEGAFLRNFLGIGDTGTLYSAGSASLVNWATGIEVAGATVLLFTEFLKMHMIPVSDWKPQR